MITRRVAAAAMAASLIAPASGLAWGREGHRIIVLIAEQFMRPEVMARARMLLGAESFEDASLWADDYLRSHPETGPWHSVRIPPGDLKIDMARDCPGGNCVVAKALDFLAVINDPTTDRASKAEALRFVLNLVGDLHQPLRCEADAEQGRSRRVIFHGQPDSLFGLWESGLVERSGSGERARAEDLAGRFTNDEREAWQQGSMADWALEAHRVAQTVALQGLSTKVPSVIGAAYERKASAAVDLQLEKAGARLAYVLNQNLEYVPAR